MNAKQDINIPIYRAKKIDSDEYVIGWYSEPIVIESKLYLSITNKDGTFRIDPTTLAMSFPDMKDSQGNKIFVSLSEDRKGGDMFECSIKFRKQENIFNGTFIYSNRMFTTDNYCVNQGFAKKFKVIGIRK